MHHPPLLRVRNSLPLFIISLVALTGSARAQGTAADRARLFQSQAGVQPVGIGTANGVDQNYAAASPNDPDLGEQAILKRVEKYEAFTIEVGSPFYYTSNVALVDRGEVSDVIIAPVAGITYAPKFSRTLYGDFTLREQFFFYNEFSGFNFASFDALAGLVYYLPKLNNLTLRANIDYNRLTGTDTFDDFFSNYALQLSAEVPIRVGRAQQISFGADANVSLYANPEPPQRNDLGVYVGYAVNVSRSFSLDGAARVLVRPYDSGGRTDVSEVIALSANYRVRDYLTLSAISTYVANQSNRSVFDYQVFNIGGGVALTWKF
ncbi:MAG: hypothetical protein H0X34_17570 [Chthoniobacterales bacterium]|jgi:hypothetical protein|nr:hypothetical protein [Chthoniobacterales bacterium]